MVAHTPASKAELAQDPVPAEDPVLTDEVALAKSRASTLQAVLEAIGGAALIVDRSLRLHLCNAAAQELLAYGGEELLADVSRALDGLSARFSVRPIATHQPGEYFLLVEQLADPELAAQLWQVGRAQRLSPRLREVLGHVALGHANHQIAQALSCADNTVEAHVGKLLEVAGVDRRTALIAWFWTQEPPTPAPRSREPEKWRG